MSCSSHRHSDASESRTRSPSVSSQALYHWATVLPNEKNPIEKIKWCTVGNGWIWSNQFAEKHCLKDLWHFDRVSAYFSDASQNFPIHKISLVSFWMGSLMYKEWIKVKIRQANPYNKTGDPTKGGRGCKIWLHQNI